MNLLLTACRPKCFFHSMPADLARTAPVVPPSSLASLDCGRFARTIQPRSQSTTHPQFSRREHIRASLPGIHRRTAIPVRGRGRLSGSVARLHRPDPRGADRAHAILRPHAGRSARRAPPVAHAGPRAGLRPPCVRPSTGGLPARQGGTHNEGAWPGPPRVKSGGHAHQSLRFRSRAGRDGSCPGSLRRRRGVPRRCPGDISRTKPVGAG